MLRRLGESLIHQSSTQISLYESSITTRDEPWFGEWELALSEIGSSIIVHDCI